MSKNIFFDINDLKYCGSNVIIGKTVRIRQPHLVIIGDGTIIDDFTYISSALEIGNYCHISSNVCISGGNGKLLIGDYSTLSSHVSVHCGSSNYRSLSMDLPSIDENDRFGGITEDVTIGEFVTVGAHSCQVRWRLSVGGRRGVRVAEVGMVMRVVWVVRVVRVVCRRGRVGDERVGCAGDAKHRTG